MIQEVSEVKGVVVDRDVFAKINVAASANGTEIVNFRARTGFKTKIYIGNDVDAGGDAYVTLHLEVNRSRVYPWDAFTIAAGVTYDERTLSGPIEVPQGAEVRIIADNSDSANGYNVTCRVKVVIEKS